ncbi:hypothetical protein MTsPCn5_28660 [Croceitalea sp. MTPC5]|uniref:hypothetical protein n=1 Tax=Croceitalea sp. MTPC5 TaxID=3056565 RepID=UPI002B37FD7C|nr:hypothetical protein MTsPCn5_28660 [Croceitalea sp. MTPC5]
MKFNWIFKNQTEQDFSKRCIELEYTLRPKITKFLLKQMDSELDGDFSCFHFDVDMNSNWVWISKKTPQQYLLKIRKAFDVEINGSQDFL